MKFNILLFLLFAISINHSTAQGMDFFTGPFEEAIEKAKETEKLIFVDAYTTWCGPCKRMKKYIFPNKKAGDFYNKHFINMAIDMESPEGKKFASKYPVRGYPTFLFIRGDGQVVLKDMGGKPMELFIDLGERALKADDRSDQYAKMYEEGNRDFDFMLKYVSALNRAEKTSSNIVYDYINKGPSMDEKQKAKFIYEATCRCDSKLFEMMTDKKMKKKILEVYSQKEYEQKIEDACWTTIKKGMEYNVSSLYDEAKKKYKKHLKKKYPKFVTEVDMAIAKRDLNASAYEKAARKYVSFINDGKEANEFAIETKDVFLRDESIAEFVESLSLSYLLKDDSIENNYYYIKILLKNGKFEEALGKLELTLPRAKDARMPEKVREMEKLKKLAQNAIKVNNKN